MIRAEIGGKGFWFSASFRIGEASEEIAKSLGDISPIGTCLPVELRPSEQSGSGPNTYSGIYGLGEFPPHTDLAHWRSPPRFLMLRCKKGYAEVRTELIDGYEIVERIGRERFSRALFQPRRPLKGKLPLLHLFSPNDPGADLVRWDNLFLEPANDIGRECAAQFRFELRSANRLSIALQDEADTLIIDNWRMLHNRTSVSECSQDRVIERVYLDKLL